MRTKSAWLKYQGDYDDIFRVAEEYKRFISNCKTERECVKETVLRAEKLGFCAWEKVLASGKKLQPGDKFYVNQDQKAIALFVIGKEPLEKGMNILGAHIDSPRLDLKSNPLYQDGEMALLDTHYYGGIKKYQWVTLPLAMHGVVVKKDGTVLSICIGEEEEDPVLGVNDLLVHLAQEQLKRNAATVVEGEDLDLTVGNIPLDEETDGIKKNILNILERKYNITEEDFLSSELVLVPAGKARDFGLDNSMIMAYGHDDKVCSYASLQAIFNATNPVKTTCCLLVDKEEVGSYGASSMHSHFFLHVLGEMCHLNGQDSYLGMRRCLKNSHMLSCDVNSCYDPLYAASMEKKNSSYLGHGVVFNKFTGSRGKNGSSEASAEYASKIRSLMDDFSISYQFSELGRVDLGGGGTIAYIMADENVQVIDSGIPVLSMHAPWEVISKVDLYEAVRAYQVFLEHC